MPDLWWQQRGVAVLLVGMGSLWVYVGCYRCEWRFSGSGSMGVSIFSLRLGLSFGSALNFCCRYLSLIVVYLFNLIFIIYGFVFLDLSLCSCCFCSRHT